ncbi:hypothetical protein HDV05_000374 [Chytridiales sp. JEL 0842]|nr:hypothetical protein HDV05_000374 [Chytridiales sp. JEL 0842]
MRYFESGRIAYFDQIVGAHLTKEAYTNFIKGIKVGPILKSASIKYIAPVVYPDTLSIGCKVDINTVGKDRFNQSFRIVSHKLGRTVAEGHATIVTYDYEANRKADIPAEVLEAFHFGEKQFGVKYGKGH